MSLIIQGDDIARVRRMLAGVPKGADKAIANAINKSARVAVTGVIKGLRKNYTLNSKQIRKKGFIIKRANAGNLEARITVRGKVLSFNNYYMTPKEPAKEIPFARVKKGGGGRFKGGFVTRMKTGHIGIFERMQEGTRGRIRKYMQGEKPKAKKRGTGQTKGRAALHEFMGPSVAKIAKNEEIHAAMTLDVQKAYSEEIEKQIIKILNKNS